MSIIIDELLENDSKITSIFQQLEEEEEEIVRYLAANSIPVLHRTNHYRSKDFFEVTIDRQATFVNK